jgi:hypothetical protein
VRKMSISENYEGSVTPHRLRYFDIFERYSINSPETGASRPAWPALHVGIGRGGRRRRVRCSDVLLNLVADLDLTLSLSGYTFCRKLDPSALAPAP